MKCTVRILRVVPLAGVLLLLGAKAQSPDTMLGDALRYLRTEIQVYASEHHETSPGYAALDEQLSPENELLASLSDDLPMTGTFADGDTFARQLTQFTDTAGHVRLNRTKACDHGPYMIEIPANPITHKAGVWVVDQPMMPKPDHSQPYGWIFNVRTRRIIANTAGSDAAGVRYANY